MKLTRKWVLWLNVRKIIREGKIKRNSFAQIYIKIDLDKSKQIDWLQSISLAGGRKKSLRQCEWNSIKRHNKFNDL